MREQLLNKDENVVAKEEIAHNEHFLLLPQCFQKLYMLQTLNCNIKNRLLATRDTLLLWAILNSLFALVSS